MPLFAVLFEDDPARAEEIRRKHMADHLAFLEKHAAMVRAAGPLRDASGEAPAGGLWLVDAESAGDVDQLVREDPFWPAGLRLSVRVLAWKQVFVDGVRCL